MAVGIFVCGPPLGFLHLHPFPPLSLRLYYRPPSSLLTVSTSFRSALPSSWLYYACPFTHPKEKGHHTISLGFWSKLTESIMYGHISILRRVDYGKHPMICTHDYFPQKLTILSILLPRTA